MKEASYSTLGGLTAPILVFTVEDFVPAGTLNAEQTANLEKVVNECNNNLVYRGVLPVVRDMICNLAESESGIERTSKIVGKTKGGKDILEWEADGAFVKRVLAEKGWNDLTTLQPKLNDACRNFEEGEGDNKRIAPLAVDLSERERKSAAPKKLAVKYKLNAAKVIIFGKVDAVNTNQLSKIGKTFVPSNDTSKMYSGEFETKDASGNVTKTPFNVSDKDAETLGTLMKEYLSWKEDQESREFTA